MASPPLRKMNPTSAPKCLPEELGCLRWLTIAILSVSSVAGIVVNGLVLWMTLFRMTRTVTTIWFFNLALADFTVLLSVPIAIYNLASGEWLLKELACKLYLALVVLTFFTSICLLVLISVDRCIIVLYPVWARNHRTVQRARWLAVGVWLLAAVTCYPYLKFRTTGKLKGCTYCSFKFNRENEDWSGMEKRMAVTIIHFLVGFLVPLAIIGTCAYLIRAKLQREGWVHASRPKRLLLLLVSAFFIFWFPFNMALLVHLGLEKSHDLKMLLILWATFSLGCLNSCLNPFLYVFIGRDFKEKFFQSLPSALARAFGEEGFHNHPVPEMKPPGDDGNLEVEAGNPHA
ncbi:probable G-protein coupled receptor 32 isoform X1 [Rhinolophus ferrumequinum]|nr:probable G-protein coupled receptor 32 isoform X1 [Rhinolophus ferrumequinum]